MKPNQFRKKPQDMSICESGVKSNVKSSDVTIKIASEHPLIQLCNALDWQKLSEMVLPDLKKSTKKGQWWIGRKLKLRIHLAIYLLQQLLIKQIAKLNTMQKIMPLIKYFVVNLLSINGMCQIIRK
ncbi:MAG: hypothetical protein U1E78_11385 [Gammaproteobacteria bacterium]